MKNNLLFLSFILLGALAYGCENNGKTQETDTLYVLSAPSGTLQKAGDGYTLTLNDVNSSVIWFTDRPERKVGQRSIEDFVSNIWPKKFGAIPPSAAIELIDADDNQNVFIVELRNPQYNIEQKTLTYRIDVLEDAPSESLLNFHDRSDTALPEKFDRVTVFMDGGHRTIESALKDEEMPSLLYILKASSGSVEMGDDESEFILTLNDANPSIIWFTVQPVRRAGQLPVDELVSFIWPSTFTSNPPNAAIELLEGDDNQDLLLVELRNPNYDNKTGTITFEITALDGSTTQQLQHFLSDADNSLPLQFQQVSIFIDASVNKPCNVFQGYNFKSDIQDTTGYMLSLKIGDKEFAADTIIKKPTDLSTLKVVGVMSNFYWPGGYADALFFSVYISLANKQNASLLIHQDLSNTRVVFQFVIYDYDPVAKKFYQSVHSNNTDLQGLVQKEGPSLVIDVADDPGSQVVSPENYQFFIGLLSEDLAQQIHMAVTNDQKFVKPWGVAVR